MATSYADSHDLEKLTRWNRELLSGGSGESSGRFPVLALFLVGPDDRFAHDVFRVFRSSFEERGAEYQHLTIFGQHGVSTTARELLAALELTEASLPMLALFSDASACQGWTLPIPKGNSASTDDPSEAAWRSVLDRVETAAAEPEPALDLATIPGLVRRQIRTGTLKALVGQALESVSA